MQWRLRRSANGAPGGPAVVASMPSGPSAELSDIEHDEIVLRGLELLESGAASEGLQLLEPLAANGDEGVMLLIAVWHFQAGEFGAAEPPLRELAGMGIDEAMYYLGAICRTRQDEAGARRLFRGGAARGHRECMFEIGTCAIKDGELDSARYWLGRAAAAGDTNAMVNFANLLHATDPDGALIWWQRAAGEGNEAAILTLQLNPAT
jgi:TPR repeat protein